VEITQRFIKTLKIPKQGKTLYWDNDVPGFGVSVTANGAISFILNYRVAGRERRYAIGRFPEWSADAARDEALDLRHEIRKGVDPLEKRSADRNQEFISDLARDYMERHAVKHKRPISLRDDRRMLERIILPRLGRLPVNSVTSRDIESLHTSLAATPYQANRVLALLSSMFNKAMEWKWREDNPVRGVERYPEQNRDTWLRAPELLRLESALREYRDQEAADAIRLLLVTGSRSSEVLQAEWPHFDLDRGVWTKPSHHTKQKKMEHVPLSRSALRILADLHENRRHPIYLFPGKHGARTTLRNAWRQVCRHAGLIEVHIHDLRHTFASHLVTRGESLHKVGKLLGHTSPSTTARYAHLDDGALRDTANILGKVYRPRLRESN
jgi:integrase